MVFKVELVVVKVIDLSVDVVKNSYYVFVDEVVVVDEVGVFGMVVYNV